MTRFFCLLAVLTFTHCAQPNAGPAPVDLQRLAKATADIHLAEALILELPIVVRDSLREVYLTNTLADNGYTRAEYDSLTWIVREEPAWIDSLYSRVEQLQDRN